MTDPIPNRPPAPRTPLDAGGPFLSVLVRTQGRRWATLQETLLCLAAQTCDDFEVLVLLHDGADGTRATLETLVDEHHRSFSSRVRVLEVSGGGRCRPLNEGAKVARGQYLATLDDDDIVFAHWVESMKEGARRAPGRVVRVDVATQQIAARPGAWAGEDGYDVVGRPHVDYPLEFDYEDHLRDNLTPNNGYAVPRSLVTDLGEGWDEDLAVLEDWDHLLRAASICGVTSVPTVAAMLRVWHNADDSKTAHPPEVWEEARRRVVTKLDAARAGSTTAGDAFPSGNRTQAWAARAAARRVRRSSTRLARRAYRLLPRALRQALRERRQALHERRREHHERRREHHERHGHTGPTSRG